MNISNPPSPQPSPAHGGEGVIPRTAYIHIPFCLSKCHYCDFNSYPGMDSIFDDYARAVKSEVASVSELSTYLTSVYFGGGTPTILSVSQLGEMLDAIKERFGLTDDCEVTVEANPGTVDEAKFAQLYTQNFNRISLGIQSFDDDYLSLIGRAHTAGQAREAYKAARAVGFDNISIDLIFALPEQTIEQWNTTLDEAIALKPEHVSVYELTIEEGTRFGKMCSHGEIETVDEDTRVHMYETTIDRLTAAGFEHYEVSNFAQPGFRCRHNMVYWHNEPYFAFGAGATSYVNGVRARRTSDPHEYTGAIASGLDAVEFSETLTDHQRLGETIALGLRMLDGIDLHKLSTEFCTNIEREYANTLEELGDNGLVELSGGRLRVTRKGLLLLDDVAAEFVY